MNRMFTKKHGWLLVGALTLVGCNGADVSFNYYDDPPRRTYVQPVVVEEHHHHDPVIVERTVLCRTVIIAITIVITTTTARVTLSSAKDTSTVPVAAMISLRGVGS